MEKTEAQFTAMKIYIKCEISNIDEKIKSLYECFNDVKETEKSNKMIKEMLRFCKMMRRGEIRIRKDEIFKTLPETQTSILQIVSRHHQQETE